MRRILFEKTGKAVWMSHLDTMRLMQRAFRRAGVLLHHSQGYTPHAYVSLILPLNVGMESCCEILEYELDCELAITTQELNTVLPEGIRVLSVYESERKSKELSLLQAELRLHYDMGVPEHCAEQLVRLLSQNELIVEKRSKRGPEETDIRPMLKDFAAQELDGEIRLLCTVCAQNPSLNPMLLLNAMERYLPDCKPDFCKCRRVEVFDAEGNVFR